MCGFVGVAEPAGATAQGAMVARMLAVLRHRGPDDDGTWLSGQVGLGFRRLSILDLSPAGHQPMTTLDGQVTIVFNGEIYNFVELRAKLETLGHRFRSSGDTEVLLASYLQWGRECLARLNGMWAFVIHDRRRGLLFGSRDRFGIKPLYLHESSGRLVFASEIKSIRASGYYQDRMNLAVAGSFLVDGRLDETPETFYAGIRQLRPAHWFEYDLARGSMAEGRFWDVRDAPALAGGDPAERFAGLFEDAVRIHMRSDVPVCVHLSGGLDSTAIVCASARVRAAAGASDPLTVFSYLTPEFDESEYVRATVAQTGAHLEELRTTPASLWADLEQMLWFQDEPVHSLTALVSYQLMRSTSRRGIKVVLNGQGADETLAGYPSYFRSYWNTLWKQRGASAAWSEIRQWASAHGGKPSAIARELGERRVMRWFGKFSPYRAWVARRRNNRLAGSWFSADLLQATPALPAVSPGELDQDLAWSQEVSPLPLYLRLEDRNSMAHSLEVRLPFLDYRVAELAYALPPEWKLRGPWNKFVLRESMKGRIPEIVRARVDKMGFPVPARKWFAEQLYEPLSDLLSSRAVVESGRYRMGDLRRDLERHRKGEVNFTDALFAVAQFEVLNGSAGKSGSGPASAGAGAVQSLTLV